MENCNNENIGVFYECNSRVLNKKYLHHKESHRKDFRFISIKGTNQKVYVWH